MDKQRTEQKRDEIAGLLADVSLKKVRDSSVEDALDSMIELLETLIAGPSLFSSESSVDERRSALLQFINSEPSLRSLWQEIARRHRADFAKRRSAAAAGSPPSHSAQPGNGAGKASALAPRVQAPSTAASLQCAQEMPSSSAGGGAGGAGASSVAVEAGVDAAAARSAPDDRGRAQQRVYERLCAEATQVAPTPEPGEIVVPRVANIRANYTLSNILALLHLRVVAQIGQNSESRGITVRVERKLGTIEVWQRACEHYMATGQYAASIATVQTDGAGGDMTVMLIQWDLDKSAYEAAVAANGAARANSVRSPKVVAAAKAAIGELVEL